MNAVQRHPIYIGFVRYQNTEWVPERSLVDYVLLPTNWLITVLTSRPWIHAQIVFWDEIEKSYVTFTVDSKHAVHVENRKQFTAGWDFIELLVTEKQELEVFNFYIDQLNKPLNVRGQLMLFIWPRSGNGDSWFCTEIIVAALAHAGLIDFSAWPNVKEPHHASMHHVYDYLMSFHTRSPRTLLTGNPISMMATNLLAQQRGQIMLQASGIPPSIYHHANRIEQV